MSLWKRAGSTANSAASSLSLRQRLLLSAADAMLPPVASLYMRTVRLDVVGRERVSELLERHGAFITAFWHNRMMPLIWLERHRGIVAMVSRSIDGEVVARVLERFGYRTVRGSSSRGAVSATKAAVKELKKGGIVAIIPDGPRGPVYTVQPGAVVLARITGLPILPATAVYERFWQVKSWDGFYIPKPFSRVVVGYGEPLYIPEDISTDDARLMLKRALFELEANLRQYIRCHVEVEKSG